MENYTHLAENIIEIYTKYARAWTELRGEFLYEKAWLDRFLTLIPVHSRILDLGCGSAKPIAAYLIEQTNTVTGVDSSDVMIEMAKQNFPDHTWILADMRTVDLDRKFDAILAWDSFFHLTPQNQRDMFEIFDQYTKAGAALMFTSGPSKGEAVGEMFGDALYHASLSSAEYHELFKKYNFEVIKMIAEDRDCTGHTVWLAKRI